MYITYSIDVQDLEQKLTSGPLLCSFFFSPYLSVSCNLSVTVLTSSQDKRGSLILNPFTRGDF